MYSTTRQWLGLTALILATGALLPAPALAASAPAQLHDPMRPNTGTRHSPTTAQHTGPRWRVNAIRIAASRRTAVINGQRVHVGDHVRGARVQAILPGAVTLRTRQGLIHVEIVSATVKTAPSAPHRHH